jgi:antitoxin (DNA-binding transcriptional repressor) of toxin-antitoxin stability system
MKTMQVAEFKSHFSSVLEQIRHGEEIAVSFGRKRQPVAVFVPFPQYEKTHKRQLGILSHYGEPEFREDFKMTDEEFLQS